MTDEKSDRLARLAARNSELESLYTHLQRTVEELNEVIIEQGTRIGVLERKMAVLSGQLGTLANPTPEPRSLEDDKPPHY